MSSIIANLFNMEWYETKPFKHTNMRSQSGEVCWWVWHYKTRYRKISHNISLHPSSHSVHEDVEEGWTGVQYCHVRCKDSRKSWLLIWEIWRESIFQILSAFHLEFCLSSRPTVTISIMKNGIISTEIRVKYLEFHLIFCFH